MATKGTVNLKDGSKLFVTSEQDVSKDEITRVLEEYEGGGNKFRFKLDTVNLKDGKSLRFKLTHSPNKTPQFEKDARKIANQSIADTMVEDVLATPVMRFTAGAADPFIGAARYLSHRLPKTGFGAAQEPLDAMVKERGKAIARGRERRGSEGFDWYRTGGNIVSPVVTKGGGILVNAAKSGWSRILGSAALGTGLGLTAPRETSQNYEQDAMVDAIVGGGLGLALPLLGEGGRLGFKAYKTLKKSGSVAGRKAIIGKEALYRAGEQSDDAIYALESAKEIVPGSRPTAVDALGGTNAAALSGTSKRALTANPNPTIQRLREQSGSQLKEVQSIAGTPVSRNAAIKAREFVSQPFYDAANKLGVKVDKELLSMSKNKFWRKAVESAHDIADTDGWVAKDRPVEFLHLVKLGVDKQLKKSGDDALDVFEKKSVTRLKARLVSWLSKNAPDYELGRAKFAEMSPKVNRQAVAHELEKVLLPPIKSPYDIEPVLTDPTALRSAQYSKTFVEGAQVIKKAGVQLYDDIARIFKEAPDELRRLNNVDKDLRRATQGSDLAKAGMGGSTDQIVTDQLRRSLGSSKLPNALIRPIMIMNNVLRRIEYSADEKVLEEFSEFVLQPKELAKVMKSAMVSPERQKELMKAYQTAYNTFYVYANTALRTSARDADTAIEDVGNLLSKKSFTPAYDLIGN